MGDENSLQGRTQAHKHSAPSSDGGFLETTITGVTNLSTGSIVYGDASEIVTELIPASNGDQLQLTAGLPSWVTPASGGANFTHLGSDTGTSVTTLSVSGFTVTPPDYVIATFSGTVTTGQGNDWRVNGLTSSNYAFQGSYYLSGAQTLINNGGDSKISGCLSSIAGSSGFVAYGKFFVNALKENLFYQCECYSESNGYMNIGGVNSTASQATITEIEIQGTSFSGTLSVWKVST